MAANTLVFTAVSGLVLLAIVAGVLQLRNWRRGGPGSASTPADAAVAAALRSPTTWTVAFLVLVLGAVAGALALVGGLPIPASAQGTVTAGLLAGSGAVLAGFLFLGVYGSVRSRGHGSAPAVGLGSLAVGLFTIVVVVTLLFLG